MTTVGAACTVVGGGGGAGHPVQDSEGGFWRGEGVQDLGVSRETSCTNPATQDSDPMLF